MSEQSIDSPKSGGMGISTFLFLIAFAGIGFTLYYRHERYYLGEDLIKEQLVLRDKPVFIDPYRGTDRYSFKAEGHSCNFWISHGGLSIVEDDIVVKSAVENMKQGDTIEVSCRLEDKEHLENPNEDIRVIELRIGNKTVIPKEMVLQKDNKNYNIAMGLSIACLVLFIFLQVKKIARRFKES